VEIQFQSNLINNLNVKPIVDLRGVIPVNPAYTWEQLCGNRNPNAITTIIVHHDALPKYKFEGVTDVELATRIANGHIGSKVNHEKGDPGFPYDIWIRGGQAYLCNDLLPLKYGVPSNNGYTIHVSVSGEYKYTDGMTDDDRTALIAVILMLQQHEQFPNVKIIKGHGEVTPTACPGIDMNKLRNDVLDTRIRIDAASTMEARRGYAYLVSQQTQYMYSLVNKNDGNEQWALNYFEKFFSLMKAEGWFK
jgi:hypothetical protein